MQSRRANMEKVVKKYLGNVEWLVLKIQWRWLK
jgi:hypothetical protein